MNIYLAGTSVSKPDQEPGLQNLFRQGCKLHSFYHTVNGFEKKWFDMNTNNQVELFLDSGAFSAWTQGVKIDIQEYIDFIKKHQDIIDVYANLDVIGAGGKQPNKLTAKKTLENQKIMERADLSPVPAFHFGEPFKYLQYYIKNYDYVALGVAGNTGTRVQPWLDDCFSNYICDSDGYPKTKIHGFAVTSLKLMLRYPWYCMTEEDHQVLTKRGWINLDDLEVGTEILAFDEGELKWQKIEEIPVFEVEDIQINHIWNRNFEAFVTNNHRWITSNQNNKDCSYKIKTTDTLRKGDCINRTGGGKYSFPEEPTHKDEFIDLLAWFWTDGTVKKKPKYKKDAVVLYQSEIKNPKNCELIQQLLDYVNEPHYKHTSKRDGVASWELYGDARDWLLSIAPNKTIPQEFAFSLTKEQAERFLEYSVRADGTASRLKRSNGFEIVVYRDKKIPNLEVLRNICTLLGIPTSVHQTKNNTGVALRTSSVNYIYMAQLNKEQVNYTGRLWCIQVSAGAFLTKCGNHIYITGNSVDSTSWVTTGRMGSIYVPRYRNEQWIYDEDSWKVSVSNRSPTTKEAGKHINNFPPKQKETILHYIHNKGYKLGSSHFEHVDQKHVLKEGKRWAEKKPTSKSSKRLLEIIEEDGLSNRYQLRDEINIIYFLDLEESMPEWPWSFRLKTNKKLELGL